ncbi:hypothetical protein BKA70DRAFT_690906 [Coprinopsis sp. MPI-PUGE-AT-0042]|nr:hypothetical protein BKA70DRAFT_690906 [Coprinopsis sp. MPI-PUGE-AT-0042]
MKTPLDLEVPNMRQRIEIHVPVLGIDTPACEWWKPPRISRPSMPLLDCFRLLESSSTSRKPGRDEQEVQMSEQLGFFAGWSVGGMIEGRAETSILVGRLFVIRKPDSTNTRCSVTLASIWSSVQLLVQSEITTACWPRAPYYLRFRSGNRPFPTHEPPLPPCDPPPPPIQQRHSQVCPLPPSYSPHTNISLPDPSPCVRYARVWSRVDPMLRERE